MRRFYDDSFHEWKVIPLKLKKKSFRPRFKFHFSFKITNHILLICKLQVYKSRKRGTLELRKSTNEIKKVKLLEKMAAQNHGGNWNSIILGNVMGNKNYKPKNIKRRKQVEK